MLWAPERQRTASAWDADCFQGDRGPAPPQRTHRQQSSLRDTSKTGRSYRHRGHQSHLAPRPARGQNANSEILTEWAGGMGESSYCPRSAAGRIRGTMSGQCSCQALGVALAAGLSILSRLRVGEATQASGSTAASTSQHAIRIQPPSRGFRRSSGSRCFSRLRRWSRAWSSASGCRRTPRRLGGRTSR